MKRVVSEPGAIYTPPPPPPLPPLNSPTARAANHANNGYINNNNNRISGNNHGKTNIIVYGEDHSYNRDTINNNTSVINVEGACKIDVTTTSGGTIGSNYSIYAGGEDSRNSSLTYTNEESNTSSRSSPPSSNPQSSECSLSSPCKYFFKVLIV